MFSLLVVLLAICHSITGQCTITIKTDLSYPEPIFIRNNNLWEPQQGQLKWVATESNVIACPRASIANTLTDTALLTCVSDSTYLLNGIPVNISSVKCSKVVTGDHQFTNQECGDLATERQIGFEVSGIGFIKLFTICYKTETASVLYTRHTIVGDSIFGSIVESYRPSFKVAGVPSNVPVDSAYTIKSQQARLTELLGSSAQAAKYVNSLSYLARGHMTPDADGIFRTWQWATYFYVNVVPQWQKVNSGNWLIVEKYARTIADRLQEDITIYTGTYGILTLPHTNGTLVPITLIASGIIVPKWTWKIIKSPRTNSAIVFISSNDPYRTSMQSEEFLCPDVCRQSGWYVASFDTYAKGFTYCCSVVSFKAVVNNIPDDVNAATILAF
uniref:DNA/RNA non-specific endonuclease domain-containing protein n=1 Tax=Anopheles atroparvus TaxID=41427 RepID=A0AAG5D1L9_ANOAO